MDPGPIDKRATAGDGTPPLEALDRFLKSRIAGLDGAPTLEKIPGGQSNPTFFLSYPGRALVLRKRPAGELSASAHAVDREYRILSALAGGRVPVPTALVYCDDPGVIGTAFYVMERVEGRVFPDSALAGCAPDVRWRAFGGMAETLAALHTEDWRARGLEDYGKPAGYFERHTTRWAERWARTKFREQPELDALAAWLKANLPPASELSAIVHGDFRIGNLMFDDQGRVAAVLDWELSTLGHPLADLAHSCICWRTTPDEYHGVRGLDLGSLGIPEEQAYLDRYYAASGLSEPIQPFHFAFALFRMAVIFEGIALRARQGNAASGDAAQVGELSVCFARRGLEAAHI